MTDQGSHEHLRASARRVLHARRGRGDRPKTNWLMEILIGLAVVVLLAAGVVLFG